MFPQEDPPKSLGDLVEIFSVDLAPLVEYSHAQMVCGSEVTLMMALVHSIPEGDLKKTASGFPTGPDGNEVDLAPFVKPARKIAKKLAALLERNAANKAAAADGQASASTAP
jgi:hypothetical protein